MNKHHSKVFSILYRMRFIGLPIIILSGFFFLTQSAEMQSSSEEPEQNLVSGRIAFVGLTVGMTTYESRINTINPDGSGGTTLPIPLTQAPGEQTWSPDGTKFAYVLTQTPVEIYSVNADGTGRTNLTNTPNDFENNPAWSATGKIAYERGGQIWTMNADGSGQAQFPAITQPSPTRPAWSFDGSKLAFASGGEIWVINADGTNQQRVTTNTSTDSEPAWSPDGTKIVFAKGGSGISVINLDGTNETPLTTGSGDTQPSWSSDGTKIAFARDGIYTMDPDGSNQVRIITNIRNFPLCCDTNYTNPTWQPVAQTANTFSISGRVSNSTNSMVGATINLSGTVNATTTTDAAGNYQFANLPAGGNYTISPSFLKTYFSPANRSFTNLSSNQTGNFEVRAVCQGGNCARNGKISYVYNGEIYAINPDGTNDTNLTNIAGTDKDPNYSPGGTKIAFSTNRDGNYEIYRMDENGSNPVRLTNNAATDSLPYFSPDESTIIFVSDRDGNNEIYRMNADGSNQIRLTNNSSDDNKPSFSPDGSKIIFTSRRDTFEKIFIIDLLRN